MISVVIPLYNKQDCIRKTIDSVLSQKGFDDFELVIVDDGSTDDSCRVVSEYSDKRIHLYNKVNGGPASARNFGVEHSQGEWILFLDADDSLEEDALSFFSQMAKENPSLSCFSANHYCSTGNVRKVCSRWMPKGIVRFPFIFWFFGLFMPRAGAAMFRRTMLLKYPHDIHLRRYEDAGMLFAIMRNERFYNSTKPVMCYNQDTLAASNGREDIAEDYIGHLDVSGKSMWERFVLYDLYHQGMRLYPRQISLLYGDGFIRKADILPYKLACFVRLTKRIINKILK